MFNRSNEFRLIHHDRSTVLYKAYGALGMASTTTIVYAYSQKGALAELVVIVISKDHHIFPQSPDFAIFTSSQLLLSTFFFTAMNGWLYINMLQPR